MIEFFQRSTKPFVSFTITSLHLFLFVNDASAAFAFDASLSPLILSKRASFSPSWWWSGSCSSGSSGSSSSLCHNDNRGQLSQHRPLRLNLANNNNENDDGDIVLQSEKKEESSDSDTTISSSTTTPLSMYPRRQTTTTTTDREMSSTQIMAAFGTSPRRIFLSFASAGAIALGGDLFGSTQSLLSSLPEDVVESTGLDTYYPRDGMKRYRGSEYGYTFLFPKQWVGDTSLELAKAQRRAKTLDYNMMNGRGNTNTLPDAAFGPPGKLNARGVSQSDTNVSVIATPLPLPSTSTSLKKTLGSPESAAEMLLRVSLAPEGSGRTAKLVSACEETRGTGSVYQFDYTVDRGREGMPLLRAISTIAIVNSSTSTAASFGINNNNNAGVLLTMTVVAPQNDWETDAKNAVKLRRVAESFKLTN